MGHLGNKKNNIPVVTFRRLIRFTLLDTAILLRLELHSHGLFFFNFIFGDETHHPKKDSGLILI